MTCWSCCFSHCEIETLICEKGMRHDLTFNNKCALFEYEPGTDEAELNTPDEGVKIFFKTHTPIDYEFWREE